MGTRGRTATAVLSVLMVAGLLTGCASLAGGSGGGAPRTSGGGAAPGSAHRTSVHQTDPVAARSRTSTHTLAPFRADGTLAVATARTVSGHCWSGSIAAPVRHAYRCFAGNTILDPCIAPAGVADPATVACLPDPWSKATVLRLTQPLPSDEPLTSVSRPWAMQLAGGARCVASTGTVPVLHDMPLVYSCTGGGSAGIPSPAVEGVAHAPYLAPGARTAVSSALTDLWRV